MVYGADRDTSSFHKLHEHDIKTLEMDVTRDDQVYGGVNYVIEQEGQVDLMVANAGYGGFSSIEEASPEAVRNMFEVNVFGVERSIRAVLPHMRSRKSGRIIVTASVVAHISLAGLGWYAATKHVVRAISNALRHEVKDSGIKVSVVEPGTVKTGFGKVAFDHLQQTRWISDYDQVMQGFDKWLGGMYKISSGPKKVVRAMEKAATARNPRAVYPASWDVRALKFLFYAFPRKWVDGIVIWLAKH